MTLIIELILAVLLVIVLMRLFGKKPNEPASAPGPDLANLKPADARTGDVISISAAGDNLEDLDFTADRCTRVTAGSHQWTELSGPYRERRVAMRVTTNEDGTEVFVQTDSRKPTVEDLGLAENDLAEMDERQNTADSFGYDNKDWFYRISREAQASTDGRGGFTSYYYWEFRQQGGNGLLTVRKAEGEPFAVTVYNGVNPGDVTVYRGSKV